jgi:hypothetical protein
MKKTIRINVLCEGTTEYNFVEKVLYDDFIHKGIVLIPHNLGGGFNYEGLRFQIRQWLNAEQRAYVTTMIDLYGANRRYPEYEATRLLHPYEKVAKIEAAIKADVLSDKKVHNDKFIPYLQLYEFEALLFANPSLIEEWFTLDYVFKIGSFQKIRDKYETPEHINDNPHTAPSKRIMDIIPAYEDLKASQGVLMVSDIGLAKLRAECKHFDTWLTTLENL